MIVDHQIKWSFVSWLLFWSFLCVRRWNWSCFACYKTSLTVFGWNSPVKHVEWFHVFKVFLCEKKNVCLWSFSFSIKNFHLSLEACYRWVTLFVQTVIPKTNWSEVWVFLVVACFFFFGLTVETLGINLTLLSSEELKLTVLIWTGWTFLFVDFTFFCQVKKIKLQHFEG